MPPTARFRPPTKTCPYQHVRFLVDSAVVRRSLQHCPQQLASVPLPRYALIYHILTYALCVDGVVGMERYITLVLREGAVKDEMQIQTYLLSYRCTLLVLELGISCTQCCGGPHMAITSSCTRDKGKSPHK